MTCLAHQLASTRQMLYADDVDLIRKMVSELPKNRDVLVADFGSGSGTATLAVFAERSKKIHVVSVDLNPNSLTYCQQVVEEINCSEMHTIFVGNTADPDKIIEAKEGVNLPIPEWSRLDKDSIDLLMIDTSHFEEETRRELEIWLPKVADGGYVWMHDYEHSPPNRIEECPAVKVITDKAVEDGILEKYGQSTASWGGRKID